MSDMIVIMHPVIVQRAAIQYIESDNVFNIQPNFEASEQETYRIRLINLGSPPSYRLKIFQLVWHWHFYLVLFEQNINRSY